MPIYAPSLPSPPFYIGKHLLGDDGTRFQIFGYPIPNYLSSDIGSLPSPWSIVDSTSLFDVSSLDINHEVVVVLFAYDSPVYSDVNFSFNWSRQRDSYHIINLSFSTRIDGSASGVYGASWIGYCTEESFQEEIGENGGYYVDVSVSGGVNYSRRIYFTVKGIPVETSLDNASTSSFDWMIKLSDYFDTNNYIRAGICTQSFTNGQTNAPGGILASQYAFSNSNGGAVAEGTATGLNQNTTYTVYGFAQTASGAYYNTGSATIKTLIAAPNPPTGVTQDLVATTTNQIFLKWNPAPGADRYLVYYGGVLVLNISSASTSGSFTATNGAQDVYVRAYNLAGSANSVPKRMSPRPPKPTLANAIVGATEVTISWNTSVSVDGFWTYHKKSSVITWINDSTLTSTSATWMSLDSNISYDFRIKSFISVADGVLSSDPLDLTYTTSSSRPNNFYWSTNVVSGVEFNLLANDWNALLNRINAFRRYKGLTDASYNVAATGQNFLATQFNQAVNNMSSIPGISTLPSTKASGNQVKASDLNLLINALNAIP